jgi:hypothetical protein
MAVYVDDMAAPFGGMIMCHMIADTSEELLAMADRIGVARRWIQYPGTPREHFDIAKGKRKKALACGAIEVTWAELGSMTIGKRKRPTWTYGQLLAHVRAYGRRAIGAWDE